MNLFDGDAVPITGHIDEIESAYRRGCQQFGEFMFMKIYIKHESRETIERFLDFLKAWRERNGNVNVSTFEEVWRLSKE